MALTPINGDLTAGVAGKRSEIVNASPDPLVTGDAPALYTEPMAMAANQNLAARTVVGLDGSGNLIPAVLGTTAAIGFLMYAANSTGQSAGAMQVEVVRGGVINDNLLVWDATYNTDEKKRKAFQGAPSPTCIIIRRPRTMTVA